MKMFYVVRYISKDLLYAGNRTFTLINIIALSIAMTVLVVLLGTFLAFRKNGQKVMESMGVGIEINPREERELNSEEKKKLKALPGIAGVYIWTPTIFLFYNSQGRLYDGLGGRTADLDDPLMKSLKDIRTNRPINFISKNEIGIIVPFVMLKLLGYLPPSAYSEKSETWSHLTFPTKLRVMVKEDRKNASPIVLEIPIVGVVEELEGGRYLIPKESYQVLGTGWKDVYRPFLTDRYGKKLFPDAQSSPGDSDPFRSSMTYTETHATVYAASRDDILSLLRLIRGELMLKADCVLEYYLQEYKQQETFFIAAASGICIVMLFFSGVILFATFQALVLRKVQEIGILKACGASKFLVYCIFALEAITISAISIGLGISIGTACGRWVVEKNIQKVLRTTTEWFICPPDYIGIIAGMALVFCILVTFLPVRMAVKVDPDQVIRG